MGVDIVLKKGPYWQFPSETNIAHARALHHPVSKMKGLQDTVVVAKRYVPSLKRPQQRVLVQAFVPVCRCVAEGLKKGGGLCHLVFMPQYRRNGKHCCPAPKCNMKQELVQAGCADPECSSFTPTTAIEEERLKNRSQQEPVPHGRCNAGARDWITVIEVNFLNPETIAVKGHAQHL